MSYLVEAVRAWAQGDLCIRPLTGRLLRMGMAINLRSTLQLALFMFAPKWLHLELCSPPRLSLSDFRLLCRALPCLLPDVFALNFTLFGFGSDRLELLSAKFPLSIGNLELGLDWSFLFDGVPAGGSCLAIDEAQCRTHVCT